MESSLVSLLAFLGTRNDMYTGIVVSNEIAVQILGNEYCYIITSKLELLFILGETGSEMINNVITCIM